MKYWLSDLDDAGSLARKALEDDVFDSYLLDFPF